MGFTELGIGWANAAAWLLVVGSGFAMIGDTINWLSRTGDQFAERSLGLRFNSVVGPTTIIGVTIVLVGVLRAL